jgi:uncharacterized protein YozE (UPF0346 family)
MCGRILFVASPRNIAMLNLYSSSKIDQLKRDANRLARNNSIGHSAALDQVAASHGYSNWSQLVKRRASHPGVVAPDAPKPEHFIFSRTTEAMYQAMRKAQPGKSAGVDSGEIRFQIQDLSKRFISTSNAIDFAISYMECALSIARYSVHGESLAYYEMRCWLPYCLHVVDGDLRILAGRDYKPLGMVQKKDWMDYAAFPQVQLKVPEQQLRQLSTVPRSDAEAGYLYGAAPWTSRANAVSYLKRLKALRDWMIGGAAALAAGPIVSKSPVARKAADARARHYVHGDQYEDDAAKFYCLHCDAMVETEHFEQEHPGRAEERYFQSLAGWQRASSSGESRMRRPSNPVNALASLAMAQRTAREQTRSPFHRWIETQTGRDDPVGDLAKDIKADRKFPTSSGSFAMLEDHLVAKGAHPHALGALHTAWLEFESLK